MPTTYPKDTSFVPAAFAGTSWAEIEALAKDLLERPVRTTGELDRWLLDRSELDAACSEGRANLYIAMTCATDDAAAQGAYAAYVEGVQPRLSQAGFELDRRQVRLMEQVAHDKARLGVLDRAARADVSIFREENVPLQTELTLLAQKYDQIVGAMTVRFDGEERTLPQMARYQEVTDRATREAAWRGVASRRLRDAEAIDAIFDQMVALRHRVATNAGFDNYVGYAFTSMHRFDYTPEHCRALHEAVAAHVVPLVRRLDASRRARLGVETLRPWDLGVDVLGRPPLKPFATGEELLGKSVATFARLDPRLGRMLASLGEPTGGAPPCLDLDSRKGKAPGGYLYMRDRRRVPFIFMNAAGLSRDVVVMLHESGHAFHGMCCADEPLLAYRSSPIEFAEVASMSMELLALPHLHAAGGEGFYADATDLARHARQQIERSISVLAWIATIDAFQLWIYANPGHTREERTRAWLALDERFGNAVSWQGLERERERLWHRQLHLFSHPLYYVEYAIAQLGALQLWARSLDEGEGAAVDAYLRGLSLGGSRPLPDLFAAAGLAFDFGPEAVGRLVDRAARELEKLPE